MLARFDGRRRLFHELAHPTGEVFSFAFPSFFFPSFISGSFVFSCGLSTRKKMLS